jgi:hypothetical protein
MDIMIQEQTLIACMFPEKKEDVENTQNPLTQIVTAHQHKTSSTIFHTATNLQESLQSDIKQIKNTVARNLKERWEAKRLRG